MNCLCCDSPEDLLQTTEHISKNIVKLFSPNILLLSNNNHGASQNASSHDVYTDGSLWAITLNFSPNATLNRRLWKRYDHVQQKKILERVFCNLLKDYELVFIKELTYEICPKLNQIHLHGLLEGNEKDISKLKTQLDSKFKPKFEERIPWRTTIIERIYNLEGWQKYIRKDQCEADEVGSVASARSDHKNK